MSSLLRRAVAAFAVATAFLPVSPASAARPVTLRGVTIVYGVGNVTTEVVVPRGAELIEYLSSDGSLSAWTADYARTDQWSGIALISRTARVNGAPANVVAVQLPDSDHCGSRQAPTPPWPCSDWAQHAYFNLPGKVRTVGHTRRHPIPAGTYQLVLSAPPGRLSFFEFDLAGPRGGMAIEATRRVDAAFTGDRDDGPATAVAATSAAHSFRGHGLAVAGVWHAGVPGIPAAFSYSACVTGGTLAPAGGVPEPCAATAAVPAPGVAPPLHASGGMPVTLEGVAHETFESAPLAAGSYGGSVHVTRGGDGPAAGAFVWWVGADAFR
ncbi:MAG TPA: hypothetical protein VFQ85_07815 [Mycobacteriales bacterium]|jgi:hypothetical protein|nr:hypothetical protein [Mycobacteriales bacterium]